MQLTDRFIKTLGAVVAILLLVASLHSESFSQGEIIWEQTKGPYGGYVLALAVNDSGHLFIGTRGGGVFRSVPSTTP